MNKFLLVALFLLTVSYVHARKQNKQNKKESLDAGDCSSVPNCAKCSRNDTCIRCVNGTFAVPNRPATCDGVKPKRNVSCVDKCPVGTEPRHSRRRGSICVKTDCNVPNCALCSRNNTCVRCENGSFTVPTDSSGKRRKGVSCVDACPEGTKPLQKPCGVSICVKTDCAPNCAACKNDKCVKCADGSFTVLSRSRFRNITCEDECPKGTKEIDCDTSGDKFCVKAGSRKSLEKKLCRNGPRKPCPDEPHIKKSCPRKPQGKPRRGGKPQGVKPPRDA